MRVQSLGPRGIGYLCLHIEYMNPDYEWLMLPRCVYGMNITSLIWLLWQSLHVIQ